MHDCFYSVIGTNKQHKGFIKDMSRSNKCFGTVYVSTLKRCRKKRWKISQNHTAVVVDCALLSSREIQDIAKFLYTNKPHEFIASYAMFFLFPKDCREAWEIPHLGLVIDLGDNFKDAMSWTVRTMDEHGWYIKGGFPYRPGLMRGFNVERGEAFYEVDLAFTKRMFKTALGVKTVLSKKQMRAILEFLIPEKDCWTRELCEELKALL